MNYRDTVKITKLPNGFTVITDEISYAKTTYASLNTFTGGWHDPADKRGLAHLSEHMIGHGKLRLSDEQFSTINQKRSFLAFNLVTWPTATSYFANGLKNDVTDYVTDIANSMTNLDYTQVSLDKEVGRITTEMQTHANNPELQKAILATAAVYGFNAPISQISGGTVKGFNAITLSDIFNHHQNMHVGNNMYLLSSGDWSHKDACEWADKNVAHLETGTKSPAIDSAHNPHDVWIPTSSTTTDFEISFPIDLKWRGAGRSGMGAYATIMQSALKSISDRFHLYGVSAYGTPLGYNSTQLSLRSSSPPNQVMNVIENVIDLLEHKSASLFQREADSVVKRIQKQIQINYDANIVTPEQRHNDMNDSMRTTRDTPLDTVDLFENYTNFNPRKVIDAILHGLKQKPSTFYHGAIADDLPTGEMIQKRDFSGRSTRSVKRSQFDLTPFS